MLWHSTFDCHITSSSAVALPQAPVAESPLRSRLYGTRSVMAEAHEYRQYAAECLEFARTATTEEVRKHFLELAKMWMTAPSNWTMAYRFRRAPRTRRRPARTLIASMRP